MEIFIFAGILLGMLVLSRLFSREKKPPSGRCKTCPELRSCGGGRPRCIRRSGVVK